MAPMTDITEPAPPRRSRLRRLLRWRFFVYVALYLALIAGCRVVSSRLVMFPRRGPMTTPAERVVLASDDPLLAGHRPEAYYIEYGAAGRAPDFYVLGFCGNAMRAEEMLEVMSFTFDGAADPELAGGPLRFGLLAAQYPGYGEDPGSARLTKIVPVGRAALAELERRAAGRPILIQGISLGGAAALATAASAPQAIAGLIVEKVPPLRTLILRRHGWWNLWLLALPVAYGVPAPLDAPTNAAALAEVPMVFVQATEDGIVPFTYQQRVSAAHPGPHRIIDLRTGHNTFVPPAQHPPLADAVRWLVEAARARGR